MRDAYALTPHALSHDSPEDNPKVAQKHRDRFEREPVCGNEVREAVTKIRAVFSDSVARFVTQSSFL